MNIFKPIRGYGTHLGLECESEKVANNLQGWFLKTGIHILKCGPKTLGLRPTMTLGVYEAAVL